MIKPKVTLADVANEIDAFQKMFLDKYEDAYNKLKRKQQTYFKVFSCLLIVLFILIFVLFIVYLVEQSKSVLGLLLGSAFLLGISIGLWVHSAEMICQKIAALKDQILKDYDKFGFPEIVSTNPVEIYILGNVGTEAPKNFSIMEHFRTRVLGDLYFCAIDTLENLDDSISYKCISGLGNRAVFEGKDVVNGVAFKEIKFSVPVTTRREMEMATNLDFSFLDERFENFKKQLHSQSI